MSHKTYLRSCNLGRLPFKLVNWLFFVKVYEGEQWNDFQETKWIFRGG